MSSTRNKNTRGNYALEQRINNNYLEHYTNHGKHTEPMYAGDGLLYGSIRPQELLWNACDVESSLYGIGSTNLVEQQPEIIPKQKNLSSLNIIDKLPIIVPTPLKINNNERPRWN